MSDDLPMHLSYNSNATDSTSLPAKLVKRDVGMAEKGSYSAPAPSVQIAQSPAGVMPIPEELPATSNPSDADDNTGREHTIQAHGQKRRKVLADEEAFTIESEGMHVRTKQSGLLDVKPGTDELSRRKHNRGRGHSAGKDHGSQVADLAHPMADIQQLEIETPKEILLQAKLKCAENHVALLEAEVRKRSACGHAILEMRRKSKMIGEEYLRKACAKKRKFALFDEETFTMEYERTDGEATELFDGKPGIDEKGPGSKIADIARPSANLHTHAQLETITPKENRLKELEDARKSALQKEYSQSLDKVASLSEDLSTSYKEVDEHKRLLDKLEKDLKELEDSNEKLTTKRRKVISDLLISISEVERQEARIKVRQDSVRFGTIAASRAGTIVSEIREEDQTPKEINARLKSLSKLKETIEKHRQTLKKWQADMGYGSNAELVMTEEDFLIQDEICESRLARIRREEEIASLEMTRFEVEKRRLILDIKRIQDEDVSRFNNYQILNHRYALLNLLGKGGSNEVYKAYDLVEYRYVACKLHNLNAHWSEEIKQSYIGHAMHEYNIQKNFVHPHIVRLWDRFEIDHHTFCTVSEYCSGKDLESVLMATPILSETEARLILVQIFQGLVYLNKKQHSIHYNLKPGNVLFDEVYIAKLTNFGLSEIVEKNAGSHSMEQTSQGSGTYWHLPPECCDLKERPPISSKVCVWSAGILFYQMLFGKYPLEYSQSQERIFQEGTIKNARKVEFPLKPTVSNEAKDLIQRCLTYNQAEIPDVLTLAEDPYFSYAKR